MRRNPTPDLESGLSTSQLQALAALLSGATIAAAARDASVDRSTLHRWLCQDYAFQAVLNRGKRELRDAMQERLMRVGEAATEVVSAAVERGDVRAALAVLKGLGLLDSRRLWAERAEIAIEPLEAEVKHTHLVPDDPDRLARIVDILVEARAFPAPVLAALASGNGEPADDEVDPSRTD